MNKVGNNIYGNSLSLPKVVSQGSITDNSDPIKFEFASYPQNPDNTKELPKDRDKQLDNVFKNAKDKLGNIPFPYSLLGGDKIKKDSYKIIDNPNFRSGLNNILESAAEKPGNANKNIIELARDKDTYKQVLDYIKKSSEDSSTLSGILNNPKTESKLYDYINSDKILAFLN